MVIEVLLEIEEVLKKEVDTCLYEVENYNFLYCFIDLTLVIAMEIINFLSFTEVLLDTFILVLVIAGKRKILQDKKHFMKVDV